MPNLSATATLRICVTPDSKHVRETHLDQTVLVSARGTNRNTIQPVGQLEESCQDTTKRSHRRQSLPLTRHTKSCWLSNFQLAIWNDWVLSRSDTSLTLGAFWHKDTCLVLVWWGAELAKLCKMLRSVSKKEIKNRCCNLRAEGSCFKCVNPMWRSDCSSVPVSNQVPPFARQSLVAKWKWLRAPSQKANRSKALEAPASSTRQRPGFMPCGPSVPDLLLECQTCQHLQTLRICATSDSKHVKETKMDQTASLNSVVHFSKPYFWCGQLMLSSFLKLLLFPTCPTTISKMSVPRTTISY